MFEGILSPKDLVGLAEVNQLELWEDTETLEELTNPNIFTGNQFKNLWIRYCYRALGITEHLEY
jgi:hypothetical protein